MVCPNKSALPEVIGRELRTGATTVAEVGYRAAQPPGKHARMGFFVLQDDPTPAGNAAPMACKKGRQPGGLRASVIGGRPHQMHSSLHSSDANP